VIQDQLLLALVRSKNEAADDVLVEALRLGNDAERARVLTALFDRKSPKGLAGVVGLFDRLPDPLQTAVLRKIKLFHQALREAGRSADPTLRVAAMRLIARGRQGRLAYVMSENLHESNELVSRAAADAMFALAEWVAAETRSLQRGQPPTPATDGERDGADANDDAPAGRPAVANTSTVAAVPTPDVPPAEAYAALVDQRPEIEAAVARALDVHRGRHGQDLLRAATLLVDSPASRAFQILATPKHGGQTTMVRRLQQSPSADHVAAFLVGASHGHLRSGFAAAFAHVADAPALDAVLRKTHWLKDQRLAVCMHTVARGAWWTEADLQRDVDRRPPEESAQVGEWLAASGVHDALQDERLERLRVACEGNVSARLRLLRVACRRKRGASVTLLKAFLTDPDERLSRMAAREFVRRRPQDYENTLLQLMAGAPDTVRRVVGRGIGKAGFDLFWNKFDRLPKPVRRQAGRAMLKLLPDASQRLRRRMAVGSPLEQRLKGLVVVQELGLADAMRELVLQLCVDADPRVRSKAVLVAGGLTGATPDALVDRLLKDADARVRANAIEVLEAKPDARFVPVLAERARAATNRERANAIKALFRMRVETVSGQLFTMLRDGRPEHRISAMWALRQVGWWQLLGEVGRLAKADENIRVRRYALNVLRNVAEMAAARTPPAAAGGGAAVSLAKAG
jgi:hypothetical protein